MRHVHTANSLLTSLVTLTLLFSLFLLGKHYPLDNDKLTQIIYQRHLNDKLGLYPKMQQDPQQLCRQGQETTRYFHIGNRDYRIHCQAHRLFRQSPPSQKFIAFTQIEEWLDLKRYDQAIYRIRHLNELPPSSEQQPKIVITLQDIDERLTQDFYGIIITEHYFNFTDKRIYGTIYSNHPNNDPNRHNLRAKRQVIQTLEQQYTEWDYLPHSRSLLHDLTTTR